MGIDDLWLSLRTGFARGFCSTSIALPVSLLLFYLVILCIRVLERWTHKYPMLEMAHKTAMGRRKVGVVLSVLPAAVITAMAGVLLVRHAALSAQLKAPLGWHEEALPLSQNAVSSSVGSFVARYLLEFAISVMLALLIGSAWKALIEAKSSDEALASQEVQETGPDEIGDLSDFPYTQPGELGQLALPYELAPYEEKAKEVYIDKGVPGGPQSEILTQFEEEELRELVQMLRPDSLIESETTPELRHVLEEWSWDVAVSSQKLENPTVDGGLIVGIALVLPQRRLELLPNYWEKIRLRGEMVVASTTGERDRRSLLVALSVIKESVWDVRSEIERMAGHG